MARKSLPSHLAWSLQPPTVEEVMHEYYVHTGRYMDLACAEESVRELQEKSRSRSAAFLRSLATEAPAAEPTGASASGDAAPAAGQCLGLSEGALSPSSGGQPKLAGLADPPEAASPDSVRAPRTKRARLSRSSSARRSSALAFLTLDGPPSASTPPSSRRTLESHTPGGSSILLSPYSGGSAQPRSRKTVIEVDTDTDSTVAPTPFRSPPRTRLWDEELFRHPVFDLLSPASSATSPEHGGAIRAEVGAERAGALSLASAAALAGCLPATAGSAPVARSEPAATASGGM